jgi:tetratricopeptide (TPR) repeat protein
LIFEVELLGIGDREPKGMSDEELQKIAVSKKEEGNTHFKAQDLAKANASWKEGLVLLDKAAASKERNDLLVILCQNIAVVCNKTGDFGGAIKSCSKALAVDQNAVKALI